MCVCSCLDVWAPHGPDGGMCGAPRRAYGVICTALFCYIFSVCWLLLNAVVPFRFSGAGGGLYGLYEEVRAAQRWADVGSRDRSEFKNRTEQGLYELVKVRR